MALRPTRKVVARPKEKHTWEPALYQFPPVHTFGFSGIRWRNAQIACLNSKTVVFPIGCGLYKHTEHCSVPVLLPEASTEQISCIAVSESGHLMAVCEKHKGAFSTVSIYNMVREPTLFKKYTTQDKIEIGNVGFSKDGKEIVVLCSDKSSATLYCWDTNIPRPRFIMSYPHHVNRICVSAGSNDIFSVSGPGAFKIWSLVEDLGENYDEIEGLEEPGTGIMVQDPESGIVKQKHGTGIKCVLTDHVWLVDHSIAIATENKVIFIVKGGEIRYKFLGTGHILCLAATPTGCYAGRKDGTIIQIGGWDVVASEYEVRSSKPYAKVTCSFVAREALPITTLVVAPNDPSTLYIVEAEKIGRLQLNEKFEDGSDVPITSFNEEAEIFGLVLTMVDFTMPVYTLSPVMDMDICVSRMLIVTSHQDQNVRIWSYAQHVCENMLSYDEQVLAVAICKYHLLVACGRIVKIYLMMADKIMQINDVNLRNVKQIKFSPSGHIVAIAAGRDVVLLDAKWWKVLATLKGHQGIVTSLAWSYDSIYLSAAGVDGAVFSWFMDGFVRYAECVTIGSLYSSIVYDANRKYVYGCGPNIPLRAVDTDKKYHIPQVLPEEVASEDGSPPEEEEEEDGDHSGSCWEHHIFRAQTSYEAKPKGITRIAGLYRNGLVCGTNDNGEFLLYAVPLSKGCTPVWEEKINAGKITSLHTDENHDLIVLATSQGSIILFTLRTLPFSKDLPERPPSPRGFLPVDELSLADILIADKEEIEEAQKNDEEFEKRIQKERNEMLYRDHMKEQDWLIQMRELDELSERKTNEFDLRLRLLEKRILMAESEKEISIQSLLENQEIALKDMNDECEKKIIKEADKAHALRSKLQKEMKRTKGNMDDRQKAYDQHLQKMRKQLEGAEMAAAMRVAEVETKCARSNLKCKMSLDMELMVNDEEVERTLKKYSEDLAEQRQRVETVFAELSYEKTIIQKSQALIDQVTADEAEFDDKLYDVLLENWRLKKLVVAIDKDRGQTRGLLLESDTRNEAMLGHLRDQEAFDQINDYKIDKLKKEKKPVAEEIKNLRKHVGDIECQQADNLLNLRDIKIVEKELQKVSAANAILLKSMLDTVQEKEIVKNNFTAKLTQIIEENEVGKWPDLTKQLYDQYVTDKHREINFEALPEKTEIKHQRHVLRKFVKVLDMAILRIDKEHAFAANRLVQKNLALLNGFSEANRNVERLNAILKELQGEEAYFRAVAAKHRYVTMATLQRLSESRQSRVHKASMSSQIHTKTRASLSLMPGSPQRRSTRSASRGTPSPILRGADLLKSLGKPGILPSSAVTEPAKTAMKDTKEEKPRAKSSIARFGSLSHPDNPLALLATETELKNKDKDIELLQKTLQRVSSRSSKRVE